MTRYLSIAGVKFLISVGVAVGGVAAWALEHFETKEHVMTLKDSRDRELNTIDARLQSIDGKIDILIGRGK